MVFTMEQVWRGGERDGMSYSLVRDVAWESVVMRADSVRCQ